MDTWVNPAARTWRGGRRVDRRGFHARLPDYRPTPLRSAHELALDLGVGEVLVKDESRRFDLPAFKMLGASWAVYRAVCERVGLRHRWRTTEELRSALARHPAVAGVRLLTATAGNHGRAVARMGRWLGIPTVVYLPAGADGTAIAAEGAEVHPVDGSYDEAVELAATTAHTDDRCLLVQDTAWPGHESAAGLVVEGYQTLFRELDEQLAAAGRDADAIVVPVGVGSLMSAAVQECRAPGPRPPALLGVEPETAACAMASLQAGEPVRVSTSTTIMSGLNAGRLSSTAWPLLRDGLDAAVVVTDAAAENARKALAALGMTIGYCGSATLAGLTVALSPASPAGLRKALGLTSTGTVVLIATDGFAAQQEGISR